MNRESQEAPITSKSIFQEDVVRFSATSGSSRDKIGLVIQNALDSENESDSEDEERITEGHVLVSWYPKGTEEVIEESVLHVVDRSLLPGDVVRRIDINKGTMKGFVSRVEVDVSLKIVGTNHILKNISCCKLVPLQEFYAGLVVVKDAWIGVVDDVSLKLTLKLKNGARCIIEGEYVNTLTDITDQRDEGSPFYCEMFYPGQCVSATHRTFRNVLWINGPRPVFNNNQRINCVVEEVSILAVKVHWQMHGYTGKTEQSSVVPTTPDPTVSKEDIHSLIPVNHLKEASIEIGDKAFYILRDCDIPKNSAYVKAPASSAAALSSEAPSVAGSSSTVPSTAASLSTASSAAASSSAESTAAAASSTVSSTAASSIAASSSAASSAAASATADSSAAASSSASSSAASSATASATADSSAAASSSASSSAASSATASAITASSPAASSKTSSSMATSTSDLKSTLASAVAAVSSGDPSVPNSIDSSIPNCCSETMENINSPKPFHKQKEKATDEEQREDEQDAYSTDESADDEDSDHADNDRDSRMSSFSNAATRRHDTRHQISGTTSRAHAARRRRHFIRKNKKHHVQVTLEAGKRVCVEVISTRTTVAVKWQDSKDEDNIVSTELLPVLHVDDLEFFPGDFVLDKTKSSSPDCYGIVQSVDGEQRTCEIKWLNDTNSQLPRCVSVYDIGDHPDFNFRPGDVVMRLTDIDSLVLTTEGDANIEDTKSYCIPPCGQVLQVNCNGKVEVIWTNETTSEVSPECLYVVHTEDGDDWSSADDDNTNSDEEWETTSDVSSDQEQYHMNPLEDVIMRSLAAVMNNQENQNHVDENHDNQDDGDEGIEEKISHPQETSTNNQTAERRDVRPRSEGGSLDIDHKESFSMIAHVHVSHRFHAKESHPINPRQFISTTRKEIIGLKSHLPNGVMVKAYENRMDLFSVLIHGPVDTPYEDGLFMFDLQLPDDYPKSPPKVCYLSQCSGRLNPNLYEDGTVCVSLLGTWSGKGNETWTSKSNICQLILSLQGLILCEEPYFNEAGYEKHKGSVEGVENSRVYNEMVIIKLLQSVENIIKRPSEAFREEINEYKIKGLHKLLDRVKHWMLSFAPAKFIEDNFGNTEVLEGRFRKPEFPLLPLSFGFCLTLFRAWKSLSKLSEI